MGMRQFGHGAALAGALLATDVANADNNGGFETLPVVSTTEVVPENVEALIAQIQATQAAASAACMEDFVEERTSMAEFGQCDLAAAQQASADLANLQAALDRRFEAIQLQHASLSQFLDILYQLQLAAGDNDAAIAQIQDLRAEALATLSSAETIEEMTARIAAEADAAAASADAAAASADVTAAENARLRAETEAFRAQSAYYEARIEEIWRYIETSDV
ncbi:hypothetical protein GW756_04500 [bacterium]|nr:hypothetical protein [bacterium]NCQ55139.1 hypothetical protein [Candidatus Parcubacteria bacterium]NCS67348.1 hypothetical protein [Candidatus Peregrinibacteria bacterium]NCS96603.1 hypothetical protein [bacterium]